MKIYSEISLKDFTPWGGAIETYDYVYQMGLIDKLEDIIDELYPDGIEDTVLNDLLWFDRDAIEDWLGIKQENDEE